MKNRPLAVHLQLVTQRRPHAGKKLFRPERLGNIVIGAEVESRNLGSFIAAT